MASTGAGYAEALAEATELGYAEPDPSADVEGFDAAAKCAILASLAFNTRVVAGDVYREGITDVTAADITAAGAWATRSSCWPSPRRSTARSRPASTRPWSPTPTPWPGDRGLQRRVRRGRRRRRLMFYGRGAGGRHRLGRARRPGRRGRARARAPGGRLHVCVPAPGARHGGRRHAVLCRARRRRPAGRARPGGDRVRRARRVDPLGAAAGQGGGPARARHPPGQEGAVQRVLEGLRGLPVVGNLASAMRVEGEEADEVLGW